MTHTRWWSTLRSGLRRESGADAYERILSHWRVCFACVGGLLLVCLLFFLVVLVFFLLSEPMPTLLEGAVQK